MRTVRLLLALPALVLPGHASRSGPTQARSDPIGELELEDVLASARRAAGRDAWASLEHGLRLEGRIEGNGLDDPFELFLTTDGRYRLRTEGPLGSELLHDGRRVTLRPRGGPTRVLEREEVEGAHLAQWLQSGFWAEPTCPLRIELAELGPDTVDLRLAFPSSPGSATLRLDRETWLPKELHRTTSGGDSVRSFEDYQEVLGIQVARRVRTRGAGVDGQLIVTDARAATPDPGTRWIADTSPASDVRFDPDAAPEVELRRVPTGHLLVHPRIDGQDVGWFVLDSGAGRICIDPGVADELGLERFGSVPAQGVAGSVEAGFRQGESLELGPLHIDDPVFVDLDLAFLERAFGVPVAGICGYEVFARSVLALDLAETTLAVHDPATFELGEDAWTPLVLDHGIPCIRCRFEGDHEGLFKIDLGDTGTVTFYSPAVEALHLLEGRTVRPSQVGGVGGQGEASAGELAWFEIAGRRSAPLPATFSRTEVGAFSSANALGNLGTSMLEPFLVVLDYTHSRIALLRLD